MPIRPFLKGATFDPEHVKAMEKRSTASFVNCTTGDRTASCAKSLLSE